MLPRTLRTERLLLRPWRFEDLPDVRAYATDPEWGRFLPLPEPNSEEETRRWLATQLLLDWATHPSWAITFEGRAVGGINARFFADHRIGELGYSIARPLWGRGLTTEAAGAVITSAFQVLPSLQRFRAMADPRNCASVRVFEKLGMRREGLLRGNRYVRGEAIDEVWYGVFRNELVETG